MSSLERPLSPGNPRLKSLGRLARQRGERERRRALLVEGPRLLDVALDAGATVQEVYLDAELAGTDPVSSVVARLDPTVVRWSVAPGALDRVGDAVTSQGLVALVEQAEHELPAAGGRGLLLVLVGVSDPGNLGTLLRAGVAAGAGGIVAIGGADHTSPKVVRSSAGAIFSIPVLSRSDAEVAPALEEIAAAGYRSIGTVVHGSPAYDETSLAGPVAIVLGNEARGLPPEVLELLDQQVTIPMAGPTESLNVAMAGTVLCFEVLRQRRRS